MNDKKERQFTFVLGYRGGTFVSQVLEQDLSTAIQTWAKLVVDIEILGLKIDEAVARQILASIDDAVLLEGMKNVFCVTFLLEGDLGLLNIIECR